MPLIANAITYKFIKVNLKCRVEGKKSGFIVQQLGGWQDSPVPDTSASFSLEKVHILKVNF